MKEIELLYQAGLSHSWIHDFIVESNKIDPQPGSDEPGSVVYDGHRDAVFYAILTASQGRFAIPHEVHQLLLREHPMAKRIRTRETQIGLNPILEPVWIPQLFWEWNRLVKRTIERIRRKKPDSENVVYEIWDLHAMFENIHPYEIYNGKTGRVLMLNHTLLVDLDPWIVPFEGREAYFDIIRNHPSAGWGMNPPEP